MTSHAIPRTPYTLHPNHPLIPKPINMFGSRAWPTPIIKPLWPFIFSAAVTTAGVWKLQDIAVSTPEALKDHKNPFAASKAKAAAHH